MERWTGIGWNHRPACVESAAGYSPAATYRSEGSPTRVDDLPAFELTADARPNDSSDPLRVYELVVADFGTRRSYFALGRVSAASPEKPMADFKAVARSLKVER